MISTPRMIRSALILLLAVGFAACGGDDSAASGPGPGDGANNPPPPPAANSVNVGDNFFNPSALTVSTGTAVTWNWVSGTDPYTGVPNSHSVTFDDGVGSSLTQSSGTHTRQFDQPGTFTYHCSVHGAAVMSAEIVVQ